MKQSEIENIIISLFTYILKNIHSNLLYSDTHNFRMEKKHLQLLEKEITTLRILLLHDIKDAFKKLNK